MNDFLRPIFLPQKQGLIHCMSYVFEMLKLT